MEKRECPGCAMEVDADAGVCPICGYEFPKRSPAVQLMAVLMILLLLIWLLF